MNSKIINKEILAGDLGVKITKFRVTAPRIAQKVKPGQFVVLMVSQEGERIPLTVVENETGEGIITLIVQEVGLTTKLLGKLDIGDPLYALVGPLGRPTEVKEHGKVILLGGGVGIAEIYPVARAFREAGNHIVTMLGARTKSLLILEEELRKVSDDFYVATDDGSYGRKGFLVDDLRDLLTKGEYNFVYAVGPIPMMRSVSQITKEFGVKTAVSLNSLMVDSTGMCGCCRVTIGGEAKFTCVDGPEFDAHLVDWGELEKRNRVYEDKEKHICRLYGQRA